jgi:hypothetical protein
VYSDANGNGILDPGELGVSGWLVTILGPVNAGGSLTGSTDAAGSYAFTGLAPGSYTVCEASRFGFMFETAPTSGPTCPFGFGYSVTVTSGQVVTSLDFGNM